MFANGYTDLHDRVMHLLAELHVEDHLRRRKARLSLIQIGKEAAPALMEVASQETGPARLEAIQALEQIRDPAAAPVLIDSLLDKNIQIRSAASKALIELDRGAIKPLLHALTRYFESPELREGAQGVLHALDERNLLMPNEIKVLEALEGPEPIVEAPWAAEAALDDPGFPLGSPH